MCVHVDTQEKTINNNQTDSMSTKHVRPRRNVRSEHYCCCSAYARGTFHRIRGNTRPARRRPRKWSPRVGETSTKFPQVPTKAIRARVPACQDAVGRQKMCTATWRAAEKRTRQHHPQTNAKPFSNHFQNILERIQNHSQTIFMITKMVCISLVHLSIGPLQ